MSMESEELRRISHFNIFFYIFGILFIVLLVRAQGLTIASAHALSMMILTRAIGQNYKDNIVRLELESELDLMGSKIENLNLRILKIEPYPEETEFPSKIK